MKRSILIELCVLSVTSAMNYQLLKLLKRAYGHLNILFTCYIHHCLQKFPKYECYDLLKPFESVEDDFVTSCKNATPVAKRIPSVKMFNLLPNDRVRIQNNTLKVKLDVTGSPSLHIVNTGLAFRVGPCQTLCFSLPSDEKHKENVRMSCVMLDCTTTMPVVLHFQTDGNVREVTVDLTLFSSVDAKYYLDKKPEVYNQSTVKRFDVTDDSILNLTLKKSRSEKFYTVLSGPCQLSLNPNTGIMISPQMRNHRLNQFPASGVSVGIGTRINVHFTNGHHSAKMSDYSYAVVSGHYKHFIFDNVTDEITQTLVSHESSCGYDEWMDICDPYYDDIKDDFVKLAKLQTVKANLTDALGMYGLFNEEAALRMLEDYSISQLISVTNALVTNKDEEYTTLDKFLSKFDFESSKDSSWLSEYNAILAKVKKIAPQEVIDEAEKFENEAARRHILQDCHGQHVSSGTSGSVTEYTTDEEQYSPEAQKLLEDEKSTVEIEEYEDGDPLEAQNTSEKGQDEEVEKGQAQQLEKCDKDPVEIENPVTENQGSLETQNAAGEEDGYVPVASTSADAIAFDNDTSEPPLKKIRAERPE